MQTSSFKVLPTLVPKLQVILELREETSLIFCVVSSVASGDFEPVHLFFSKAITHTDMNRSFFTRALVVILMETSIEKLLFCRSEKHWMK